jgi:hypothetical protein
MTDDPFVLVGSAAALAGAVIGAFWKYEEVASPEAKVAVASWLRYRGAGSKGNDLARHLVVAFNKIFGERHFTLKCFGRSCLASLIAICIVSLIWGFLRPDEAGGFVRRLMSFPSSAGVFFIVVVVGFNCIPDYLSYSKLRRILMIMARTNGFARLWALALFDTLSTLAILACGIVGVFLAAIAFGGIDVPGIPSLDASLRLIYKVFFSPASIIAALKLKAGNRTISPGVFLYSALFVSAWSWLYVMTALTTRFIVQLFPKLMTRAVWFFDVEGHPLRSFGCIAGGIVFVGIVTLRIVIHF